MYRFGDRVRKTTGDYIFEGIVVAVFHKLHNGPIRYVVEDERGILLIMSDKQLGGLA